MVNKDEIIRNFKIQVKSLEAKIEGSEINQKYLNADKLRSHWHSKYIESKTENHKLKKESIKKQKYIDKIRKKINKIL